MAFTGVNRGQRGGKISLLGLYKKNVWKGALTEKPIQVSLEMRNEKLLAEGGRLMLCVTLFKQ